MGVHLLNSDDKWRNRWALCQLCHVQSLSTEKPVQQTWLASHPAHTNSFHCTNMFLFKDFPIPREDSKWACIFMTGACIVMSRLKTGKHLPTKLSSGESIRASTRCIHNTNAWCIAVRMHRRPCRKIDFDNNGCVVPAGECCLFKNDSWKPSPFREGRYIMQKSQGPAPACLYSQEHTRFFP